MENRKFLILDGAMGTMLQAAGLPAGTSPELWNLSHPEVVTGIQKQYVDAGSDVIFANTFGASRIKLGNCGHSVGEVVSAGIAAAKAATAGTNTRVALDIGPLGKLMAPLGTLSFEEAYDVFREMLVAGEKAGADLVIFETMSDLREIKAGVLAAKEHTSLEIWTTMTFEASGRTFVGVSVPAMALTLSALGVDAMGFNCSLGPGELLPMMEELARWTDKPLILKPNAGLPDGDGNYSIAPEEFAQAITKAAELGVCTFGGCCGTGPAYIGALKAELETMEPKEKPAQSRFGVCSSNTVVEPDQVETAGLGISPENDEVAEALEDQDFDTLADIAMEDLEEDVDLIGILLPEEQEQEAIAQVIQEIQAVVSTPLLLRAHAPEALESALRACNGRPAVEVKFPWAVELCKKYGAVAVTVDADGSVTVI